MQNITAWLVIVAVTILFFFIYLLSKLLSPKDSSESNFVDSQESDEGNYSVSPVQREHVAYAESQNGIMASIVKKAPRMIMTIIIFQLITSNLSDWIPERYAEGLSMAGYAFSQGDYGTASASVFSMAKPELVYQYRITIGSHPYLNERKLDNFTYVGTKSGENVAIMTWLYSTNDHDNDLKQTDKDYGNVLTGLSAERAIDICEEKYNGQLISIEEWNLAMNHILAARNIKKHPLIPEWTRNSHKDDSDDFLVIEKQSKVKELAEKEDIDREEGGLYIDGDDLSNAGFRCSITWKNNAGK